MAVDEPATLCPPRSAQLHSTRDSGNGCETTRHFVVACPICDLFIEGRNATVHLAPLRPHVFDQHSHSFTDRLVPLQVHRSEMSFELTATLGNRVTLFQQKCPKLIISAVRSPTYRSRARCSVCMSSGSVLFQLTNRIVGLVAASAIASASRSSFFCDLT